MSVRLPPEQRAEELVAAIIAAIRQGDDHERILAEAQSQFGLSQEDAELALDRVCGGMFRAQIGSIDNCPNRAQDPIAWLSFQKTFTPK